MPPKKKVSDAKEKLSSKSASKSATKTAATKTVGKWTKNSVVVEEDTDDSDDSEIDQELTDDVMVDDVADDVADDATDDVAEDAVDEIVADDAADDDLDDDAGDGDDDGDDDVIDDVIDDTNDDGELNDGPDDGAPDEDVETSQLPGKQVKNRYITNLMSSCVGRCVNTNKPIVGTFAVVPPEPIELKGSERRSRIELTTNEIVSILSKRCTQLKNGAPAMIRIDQSGGDSESDVFEIAKLELLQGLSPIKIRRRQPSGNFEIWTLAELVNENTIANVKRVIG